MGFIAAKCPNCGATIELSEDREYGFCTYCGTKVFQDKLIVEHRGNVSVSGIASVDTILDRAFLLIEDRKYSDADKCLEKALDINPRCSKAYLGKVLCQYKIPSVDQLKKSSHSLDNNDFFKKAVRFATPTELSELELIEKSNLLRKAVNDANELVVQSTNYLNNNKKNYQLSKVKSIIFLIASIIIGFIIALFLIGFFSSSSSHAADTLIILLPLGALEYFFVSRRRKATALIWNYKKTQTDCLSYQEQLIAARQAYEVWTSAAQ